MKKLVALAMLAASASPLWATTQSVTLSVPDMNCATCPITVKKALTKVSGVSKIDVNLDRREAKVTFDDTKANVEVLTRATRNAGYPATVLGDAK
ncbi:mercuric transport protein periplasmic component [Acidovorax delafieldii 2AN]|jgi:mercuric ion binding protein|uniref:Periplasmic mercury ion-binding protein n=3 Tax=Acidovorax TaxID=12916 RepID=C5T3X8_ACIDE|nr:MULTISPECIES: mercury resistance system periplasmic binding protein MerP [Comamonadaceae]ABM41684.1 mercuric transport protein periplasmic component [Acidovorax sp. JS42]GAO24099.1 MerP protein [Alicycliphilus sp. B1]ART50064.1 mercuric transport protein periplasmic component [Acidovorax carolinensis]ART53549.1 mercuric transport protein periplasmic component [Acidovorax carolinensis]ART56829.1 mercuric transport protein periplasmic component [Acidovorax carolinensis]